MTTFFLPLPEFGTSCLGRLYDHAIADRAANKPKVNPSSPVREFEAFRAFELGWYRSLSHDDFNQLAAQAREIRGGIKRGRDNAILNQQLLVIDEILEAAPWYPTQSGAVLNKADIQVIGLDIARSVHAACERAASKSRPLSNINLDAILQGALATASKGGRLI